MADKIKSQELLNQQIIDAMLEYQIDLRRYEAGVAKSIAQILEKMRNEMHYALISTTPMSEFDRARTNALVGKINKIINQFIPIAQGELGFATDPLPKIQAAQVANMLNTIGISTAAVLPSEAVLARLADTVLFEGNYIAEWWQKLGIDASFRMSASIRQGIVQGESNQKIINRIVGKPGTPGEMDITKRNVAAFVNTAVQTVANEANMKTLQANADVVPMVRWLSALDGRVCERCMARDGLMWKNEEGNAPVGHDLPFSVPPIHFNDRCVLIPVTRLFEKMRKSGMKVPEGQRASELGPVSSKTTFEDFLKRRTEAQQDAQLGKGRAQMWRDGKITLSQLLDGNGRELTLEQLKKKYG